MDLIVGEALTLVLKRPAGSSGTGSAAIGTPTDAYYKLATASIDALQLASDAWIIVGLGSGEVVQLPTDALLPSYYVANSYDNLAVTHAGVALSGCGDNVWGANGFEVLTGLPGGSTCWAYPTTANFYDFQTNASTSNDGGAVIYLRGVPGLGLGQSNPAASCLEILTADPGAASQSYWIDPNGGATTDAFEVYCDMTFDNGGWTLLVKHTSTGLPFVTTAQNLGDMAFPEVTSDAKVADAAINALTWTQWRIEVDGDAARHILSQSGSQFNVAWTSNYNAWPSGSADNGRNQQWCYVNVPAFGTQCYNIGNTNTYAVSPHEANNGGTWVHAPHATTGSSGAIGGFSCGFGTAAESSCTIFTGLDIRHWVR
ncbi:MAG: hypothetical protein EP329_25415 [Deltaproteobacteria bacterium]|nr:MAG: hypothetical protein EP329_25415 [Deltaproteobacteria bacterium]